MIYIESIKWFKLNTKIRNLSKIGLYSKLKLIKPTYMTQDCNLQCLVIFLEEKAHCSFTIWQGYFQMHYLKYLCLDSWNDGSHAYLPLNNSQICSTGYSDTKLIRLWKRLGIRQKFISNWMDNCGQAIEIIIRRLFHQKF